MCTSGEILYPVGMTAWPTSCNTSQFDKSIFLEDSVFHLRTSSPGMQDLYHILQCHPNASQEEIRQSFKRLALLHHPDKGQSSDSTMFVKISNAWEVLKDEQLRHEYDIKWREWCSVQHLPIQEEVDFSDFDDSEEDFIYPCRCGDYFVLTKTDAKWMFDIVCCETCSLTIRVLYYKDDV